MNKMTTSCRVVNASWLLEYMGGSLVRPPISSRPRPVGTYQGEMAHIVIHKLYRRGHADRTRGGSFFSGVRLYLGLIHVFL